MIILDNDVIFDGNKDKKQFLIDKEILGSGYEGEAILYENKVLKFFFIHQFFKAFRKKEICFFKDFSINNVYFTNGVIYNNGLIIGSVADYASGSVICEFDFFSLNINDLISSIQKLISTIVQLSDNRILLQDIHENNIIFDGIDFKFIDTSSYKISNDSYYDILYNNLDTVMSYIYDSIFYNAYTGNLSDLIFHTLDFPILFDSSKYNIIELLIDIKNSLQNYLGIMTNCFGDAQLAYDCSKYRRK